MSSTAVLSPPAVPSTWPAVYTVFLHRALLPYRLQHVRTATAKAAASVRRFRITLSTPPSTGTPAFVASIAERLHNTDGHASQAFVLPFRDGVRACVTPLPVTVDHSRFRSAIVAIDPTHAPTRSWTDFDMADKDVCTANAAAIAGTQLAQYQRRSSRSTGTPAQEARLVTNPRFPTIDLSYTHGTALRRACFDQVDFTCGDWSDVWYHALYKSYTEMRAPTSSTRSTMRAKVKHVMSVLRRMHFGPHSPYVALSPKTTRATLTYAMQHLQKGIYVRIRQGRLDAFLPFCRYNYTNTVYDQYYLPKSPDDRAQMREMHKIEAALRVFDAAHRDPHTASPAEHAQYTKRLARLLELEYICAQRYANAHRARSPTDLKANPNRRQWLPNNHFANQAVYFDHPNVHHFHYLLRTLVAHRRLPDAEFVLNLRDHPVLRATHDAAKGSTTLFNPYPDLEREASSEKGATVVGSVQGGLTPILSHTGKDGYADMALPTVDDIQHFSQRVFMDACKDTHIDAPQGPGRTHRRPDPLWVDWSAKTIPKAVFRGSGTGRGTTADVNQRLQVWRLAHTPSGRAVLDVELTGRNEKPKVLAGDAGLAFVHARALEAACGARIDRRRHYLSLRERSAYKYVLCLDGQTRADRMLNEMRTGSVVILPTPPLPHGGHRLWLEPFLCPLHWETAIRDARSAPTAASVRAAGYTHMTIDNVGELDALVRWLNEHDAVAEHVALNVQALLFDPVHGLGVRRPPATCFMYDYMEAVVRLIAQHHAHSTRRPFTLIPSPSVRTKSVVGIVVGFRDDAPGPHGGVRTAQLRAFEAYFKTLFPSTWVYDLAVATHADVPGDREDFDAWWTRVWGADRTHVRVSELAHALRREDLPRCLVRNLALVRRNVDLALGLPPHPGAKREAALRRRWDRSEAYRRMGQEKFNLGRCKNQGYKMLKAKHGSHLSHVVFTDIDMLPDDALAPWYAYVPKPHEVVALAHRGTVYDTITVDNLPIAKVEDDEAPVAHTRRSGPRFRTRHRGPRRRRPIGHRRGGSATRRGTRGRPAKSVRAHGHHQGARRRAMDVARRWCARKQQRFLGAALSIHPRLFEAINGYPNSFWGWGGEDDAVVARLSALGETVTYTVPPDGRLIDLEMAQPVTFTDKLAARVKEQQKRERLRADRTGWKTDGLAQV